MAKKIFTDSLRNICKLKLSARLKSEFIPHSNRVLYKTKVQVSNTYLYLRPPMLLRTPICSDERQLLLGLRIYTNHSYYRPGKTSDLLDLAT